MSALSWFEISVFIMLSLVFLRFFFANRRCAFVLSNFAIVSFFFLLTGFFSVNFNFSYCAFFLISIFALFVAMPEIFRARMRIFIYDYSFFYHVVCVFGFLLLLATAVFSAVFRVDLRPKIEKKRIAVIHKTEQFVSAGKGDFLPKTRAFEFPTAVAHIFYPKLAGEAKKSKIYVILPNIFAGASDYFATAECLAERGNVVLAADFFESSKNFDDSFWDNPISRHFYLRLRDFFDDDFSKQNRQKWDELLSREMQRLPALLEKIADSRFQEIFNRGKENLVFVADNKNLQLALAVLPKESSEFRNFFILNPAENPIFGYIDGFGDLAVFHPFEYFLRARKLGMQKTKGWTQARLIASKAASQKELQ